MLDNEGYKYVIRIRNTYCFLQQQWLKERASQYYGNSGRVAAAGEKPQLLVCWVLAVLRRSQHMCLFSESREVL